MVTRAVTGSSGNLLQAYEYGFDRAGTMLHMVEEYTDPARNRSVALTYDNIYRLTEEKATTTLSGAVVTTTYGYDAANNRTSKAVTGGTAPGSWAYTPNNLNQLKTVIGTGVNITLEYDADGNRISRNDTAAGGLTTYQYDCENRLVGGNRTGLNFAYEYDYRTRRISRKEGALVPLTSVIFSGGLSRAESAAGTTTMKFVRGRDLGGGVDGLLATTKGTDTRYVHSSGRGDVTLETDPTGVQTYGAIYEAHGKRVQASGFTQSRYSANTKEEDPTGLLNDGLRYRDRDLGVFITRDPAGFVDGPNVYAYVRQNPWSKFDPDGLAERTRVSSETYFASRASGGYQMVIPVEKNVGDKAHGWSKDWKVSGYLTYNGIDECPGEVSACEVARRREYLTKAYAQDKAIARAEANLQTAKTLFSVLPGASVGIAAVEEGPVGALKAAATEAVFAGVGYGVAKGVAALKAIRGSRQIAMGVDTGMPHMPGYLPNNAPVIRGGQNLAENFANGSGVSVGNGGLLDGVSVNASGYGQPLAEIAAGIPHRKVGLTTVGDIRAVGGDVIPSPNPRNPWHATLSGVDSDTASKLMQPLIPNPSLPR